MKRKTTKTCRNCANKGGRMEPSTAPGGNGYYHHVCTAKNVGELTSEQPGENGEAMRCVCEWVENKAKTKPRGCPGFVRK